ncbi:MAG: trypsin-like peptidase domain-containing protein [Ilumatobacteraceae bacterium]
MRRLIALIAVIAVSGVACADDTDPGRVDAAVVSVVATGCGNDYARGTATIVDIGSATDNTVMVLTSAHTVAGADRIDITHDGVAYPGTIAAFDPNTDLAVIAVQTRPSDAIAAVTPAALAGKGLSTAAAASRAATVVLYRDDIVDVRSAEIARRVNITTENVYLDGDSRRPGYELRADIATGDSGAPVVIDGRVHAVLWSRSRRSDERAWAVDVVHARTLIDTQIDAGDLGEVDPTRCRP